MNLPVTPASPTPLRFAFITTNLAGGGAEKAMLKIARLLAGRGHEVHLVLFEKKLDYPLPGDLPVHVLSDTPLSKGFFGRRLAAWRLRRLVDRLGRPKALDLVVSTLPFADEVARMAGLPRHVCRIANTLSAEIARLAGSQPAKAERRRRRYRQLYGAGPLVAVSRGVADDLRQHLHLNQVPVVTLPNPFDPAGLRALAGEGAALPDGPYVIHVGRFAGQKRHDLLLDAWSRLGESGLPHRLVLLAENEPALAALIAAKGLSERVSVAGFQPNPYPWMAGADLLVLCSDHEGLPNVLLEALACGTPVVSTDCPSGPAEILAALPDCLVPCGDAPALAAAIARHLAVPPDLSRVDFAPYAPATVAAGWEALARSHPLGAV